MMKRIVATLFFLGLVLCGLALVLPGFIDWSRHKEQLLAQLEPYIQRRIEVGGAVSFRLLPNPQIMLQDVTLANPAGAKSPHFVKLRQLEARMKLGPLLRGRFEVENINLAGPEVNLEVLPDGANNWSGIFREAPGDISRTAQATRLNQVSMTDGTLHYINQATGVEAKIENLDLTVGADTLFGPYRAAGSMVYNGAAAGIEIRTERYESGAPVPVNIAFLPKSGMPQVRMSGVADLSSGLGLQGEINVTGGTVASLFQNGLLNGIEFLNEDVELTAMLKLEGGEAKLEDIRAKAGKKGKFSGNVTVAFAQGQKPDVLAELSGKNLKVTTNPVFLDLPESFTARLKLQGYGIHWSGAYLPAVSLSADAGRDDWAIKDLRIDSLPGKASVKLAGVITPKNKYSAFSMQLQTSDLQKTLGAALLPETSILKALEKSGIVRKLDLSCSLDLTPEKISLFGIDAKINGETKASGVLNIARGGKKPGFDAHINFDKGDAAAVFSDGWSGFMAQVMKSGALLDITVGDFTKGDVAASDLVFKGKVADGSLQVEKLAGTIGSGSFEASGKIGSLNPLAGMDMTYALKAGQLGNLGAFGIEIPPPLWGSHAAGLAGKIQGDAKQFSFTASGKAQAADIILEGTATQGNQGTYVYQTAVSMKKTTWAQLGLPIDSLVAKGGPFDFSAKLSGTRGSYQLAEIKAGSATGALSRSDSGYSGALAVRDIDFDAWTGNGWKVTDALDLKLRGKKMVWRSNDIANPELQLEAGPGRVRASGIRGEIWGGGIAADVSAEKIARGWKGAMKGSITGADLQRLAGLMELKGFNIGVGDLVFDMTDDDGKTEKDWFHGMEGDLSLKADKLTVRKFSPGAVIGLLSETSGSLPAGLAAQVTKAMRAQSSTYAGVEGEFRFGEGKIVIGKLKLANPDASVAVTGSYSLGPETFSIKADVQLKEPAGAPQFGLSRSGKMEDAPGYLVDVTPLETWLAGQVRKVEEPPPPAEELPLQNPPEEPAPAPSLPEEPPLGVFQDDGGTPPVRTAPVEVESLDAPPSAAPGEEPVPAEIQPLQEEDDGIGGVLRRLRELPEEPAEKEPLEPPVQLGPSAGEGAEETEILPDEEGIY